MNRARVAAAILLGFAATASLARADSWTDSVVVHGFVSFSADANFNRPEPDSGETFARNRFRAFDTMANTLSLDVATLTVERVPVTPHDIGVRIDLAAGQTVPQGEAANGSSAGPFDLQRAYLYYVVDSGFRLDLGKFATPAGPEAIEGYENWNDNYSHSLSFTYGPKTHTGVKVGYGGKPISVAVLVTTGWDTLVDNNTALSFGGLVIVRPLGSPELTFQLLYLGGKELPDPDPPFRHFVDAYAIWKALPLLKLTGHFNYAHEDTAHWWGVVGYVDVTPPSDYSIALRGELFDDPQGRKTLTAQTLGSLTLTGTYKFGTHHAARLEVRWDRSSVDAFTTRAGVSPNQVTIAANYLGMF